jgi:AraC-like DNA-binding protein
VQRAALQIANGVNTSEQLARSLGLHRRALERMFRREVGLSPKRLIRIHRVQAVLAHLEACSREPDWAALALSHGYSDQSHMIREFNRLAGRTPARHLALRSDFSSCFEGSELSRSFYTAD